MKDKIHVAVLFGGRSAEHEVSLQSARSVVEALDKDKYTVTLIGIDKQGQWHVNDASESLLMAENPKLLKLNSIKSNQVALVPWGETKQLIPTSAQASAGTQFSQKIDVVFPVLHGTYGEDGTMQGLLKLANIPFVGPSVLGSAVGMDKDVAKRLMRDAGIGVARWMCFRKYQLEKIDFAVVSKELGLPMFVKPANLGSSVGVRKVKNAEEFKDALRHAFTFDTKVIVEEFIQAREIEVSVLGNDEPMASIPGEIIPQHEFYSYEAKYIDGDGAKLAIPADLTPDMAKKIQEVAVETFKVLCLEGMSRVDFFLSEKHGLMVNEVNTIPGFTSISMYPKLWEASGISFQELVNRLIELAIERFRAEEQLQTTRDPQESSSSSVESRTPLLK